MRYNKLVRDKIPELIGKKGKKFVTHLADDVEYWEKLKEKLKEKLREEVDEFILDNNAEELTDVLEVIDAICEFNGYEVEESKERKKEICWRFDKRIILEEVE